MNDVTEPGKTLWKVVIMAGGASTRLWPESRARRPKWMLDFGTGRSLLQRAYDRARMLVSSPEHIMVITSDTQADLVENHLSDLPAGNIIQEPVARDTAGCAAYSVAMIERATAGDDDVLVALLPGDQFIAPQETFVDEMRRAGELALDKHLIVTLGIVPRSPATNFGYIHCGDPISGGKDCFNVREFVEKPSPDTARQYLLSGGYYWNAGIFVFRPKDIIAQFDEDMPAHAEFIRKVIGSDADKTSPEFQRLVADAYESWPKISIDYGVIEGASQRGNVGMVAGDLEWSDVGSWSSIADHLPVDDLGNAYSADIKAESSYNNVVYCRDANKRVVLVEISNLVIVDTPDALLITRRSRDQDVKKIVNQLIDEGRNDLV